MISKKFDIVRRNFVNASSCLPHVLHPLFRPTRRHLESRTCDLQTVQRLLGSGGSCKTMCFTFVLNEVPYARPSCGPDSPEELVLRTPSESIETWAVEIGCSRRFCLSCLSCSIYALRIHALVCMYVCMYVYIYVCVYIYIYMYVCMCVGLSACLSVCLCACMYWYVGMTMCDHVVVEVVVVAVVLVAQ